MIREAKKLIENLRRKVTEHEQLTALKKFMEDPVNKEFKNEEQLQRVEKRRKDIEELIYRSINF